MAVITFRHLLLAASLLLVAATLGTAQEPPRTCLDTGLVCINDCVGQTSGIHQWCGDCNYFVQCNGEIMYIQPCANGTYYSDDVQACGSYSNTCEECVVYAGSTSPAPSTPPGGALCGSTGPDCISDCDQVTNGIYQWCARCDYFIQCSGSSEFYTACQEGLVYDHSKLACDFTSTTCFDDPCYGELATTPAPTYCTSSPCFFGGTCIQEPGGGFDCICAPGYTGVDCSIVISYCESVPCQNGATCLPIVGGFVCQCPPGWTGTLCQYPVNNCNSQPCVNGGTCFTGGNGYTCICPPEFTGPRCEHLTDPCGSQPCINGGTCVNNCGISQCLCPPQWTGTFCDTYIDHCASSPCKNGATCQNGPNGWTCVCPPSFTGLICDQVIDLCASRPCLNGGTCAFDCGIYMCFCPDGWTGYNCQTPITACTPNPCLNGGTCTDLGGIYYSCICPPELTGPICESPNYNQTLTCGDTLYWSEYPASNGFTRLCYFQADPSDISGRNTQCRYTIQGIPLYDDYTGLLTAGGNFGCLVSQNYPDDLPATSVISCDDNYQHDVTLGNYNDSARLMVCLRYPYAGVPLKKLN